MFHTRHIYVMFVTREYAKHNEWVIGMDIIFTHSLRIYIRVKTVPPYGFKTQLFKM